MSNLIGERQLWCAVVKQAWMDLFAVSPSIKKEAVQCEKHRVDARLFFTKRVGKWAKSREAICSIVGLDPDALRERAERELKRTGTCEANLNNKHTLRGVPNGKCSLSHLQDGYPSG